MHEKQGCGDVACLHMPRNDTFHSHDTLKIIEGFLEIVVGFFFSGTQPP